MMTLLSTIEPKNIEEALSEDSWVIAMEEELSQFTKNTVWNLVPPPMNHSVIGNKWVLKNKLTEEGEESSFLFICSGRLLFFTP